MTTYIELKKQAEELLQQAEAMRESEKAEIVADIRAKIDAYEISAADLGFAFGPSARKQSATKGKSPVAKFKGPNGELWSGRGRQPKWMVSALAAGQKVDQFRI